MKKNLYKTNHYRIILSVLLALILTASAFAPGAYADNSDESDVSNLKDSGIDYKDGRETVTVSDNTRDALYRNPYRGFHIWAQPGVLVLKNDNNNTAVSPSSSSRSLIYFPVDMSDFSGAYHPTVEGARGEDALLNESALVALDETLKNVKKNNNQVILRFVYDQGNNGVKEGEGCIIPDDEIVVPRDWVNANRVIEPRQDMILQHIEQLAPVLIKNQDAIYTVQIGFYGEFGELHSTGMVSDENIAGALNKMLIETKDSNLRISARTPKRYAFYRGINVADIESDVTTKDEDAYRVAIFNDGYLGTNNDWGTFVNRTKETNWMATQNLHNPYGGDAIPDTKGNVGDYAKQPAVLNEMFKVHTSYASADYRLVDYWKDTPYNGSDEEYEGASLYEYIENHLGYRFVLRESKLSESVKKGGTLRSEFEIENVGFGNLFYPMESYAYILDEVGRIVVGPQEVDIDPTDYKINEKVSKSMDIVVPADIAPGEYKLYLQFKIGDREVDRVMKPYGALRLANKDVWNQNIEANYLGSFTVDRELKITKKWEDGSHEDARPDSLTFTVEKLPEKYQRVEYIEANGTQWIDTGVQADASHTIYSDGRSQTADANQLLQSFQDTDTRLGLKMYGGSKRIQYYWSLSGEGVNSSQIEFGDLDGLDINQRFQVIQDASGISFTQGSLTKNFTYTGATSGTTGTSWKIFYYNVGDSQGPKGFLYEAKILNGDELLHHYVPCYRKSDGEIGVYDMVDKKFLTNAGTGTFGKGDDISNEVIVDDKVDAMSETITVAKDDWTINGDVWETSIFVRIFRGFLSIFEHDIDYYISDANEDNKKELDEGDAVEITNSVCEHEWNEPEYVWSADNKTVTATRTCKKVKIHKETEVANSSAVVISSPTYKTSGTTKYQVIFKNDAFQQQEKTVTIPKETYPAGADPDQKARDGTALGPGASAAAAEKSITSSTSDEGPAGSKFALLSLRSTSQGKSNIKLTWNRVGGAASYVVYGNACGKNNKMQRLAETGGASFNVTKIRAGLKKGTYHKFMVVALDSKKNVVSTSKVIHVATKGGKAGNPTKITVKKAKALKVGKSLSIKAKQKGKKVKKHRGISYESSNPAIATVNAKGKVTAKKKGSCYIYAYTQNGIYKKVKIVVK